MHSSQKPNPSKEKYWFYQHSPRPREPRRDPVWIRMYDGMLAPWVARHYHVNAWDAPSPKRITAGAIRRLRKMFRSKRWGGYFLHIRIHRRQERRLRPELCQQRRNAIKQVRP